MLCRRCMIVMEPGTTYEKNKDRNNYGKMLHRRFCQCPKCKERVYNSSSNFQETMKNVVMKSNVIQ